jgi:hypothetical protein
VYKWYVRLCLFVILNRACSLNDMDGIISIPFIWQCLIFSRTQAALRSYFLEPVYKSQHGSGMQIDNQTNGKWGSGLHRSYKRNLISTVYTSWLQVVSPQVYWKVKLHRQHLPSIVYNYNTTTLYYLTHDWKTVTPYACWKGNKSVTFPQIYALCRATQTQLT